MRVIMILVCAGLIGLSTSCALSDPPSPSGTSTPAGAKVEETSVVEPKSDANVSAESGEPPAIEPKTEVTAAAPPVMDEMTGVAVGQKVPSFELEDQDGERRSLDKFLADGNVALVFYRSADW